MYTGKSEFIVAIHLTVVPCCAATYRAALTSTGTDAEKSRSRRRQRQENIYANFHHTLLFILADFQCGLRDDFGVYPSEFNAGHCVYFLDPF